MKLNGEQIEALVDALSDRFSLPELHRLARYSLDKDYDDIVPERSTKVDAAFAIVEYAKRRDLVVNLVEGARGLNPTLPQIEIIFELAGISSIPAAAKPQVQQVVLERIVAKRSVFQNPAAFRERMACLETWTCRVDVPGGGGTGLLVAPDLVLTNHHVLQPVYAGAASRDNVDIVFDYRALSDGTELIGATRCKLAPTWDVDRSPPSPQDDIVGGAEPNADELDYALVRLARKVGEEPIASKDPEAQKRGWFPVAAVVPAVVATDPLFVMQYPADLRLQLAVGAVLGFSAGGTRLRHDARTLGGSSGSPCFDANLSLVALHHAGDPDYRAGHVAAYNQSIPLGRILHLMNERSVTPFWEGTVA